MFLLRSLSRFGWVQTETPGTFAAQKTGIPGQYSNSLYIAFHGSWNRTIPTGYKVVRVPLKDGKVAGPVEDFIIGWLTNKNNVTGRPVGLTFAPDGSLFISDDLDNVIYHVWYQG